MKKYKIPHCLILVPSAIGDTIAALPTVKYAYEKIFKKGDLKVYIQKYCRILFHFIEEEHIIYYDGCMPKFNTPHKILNFIDESVNLRGQKILAQRISLVDFASLRFFSIILQGEDKNYVKLPIENADITKFELPDRYVCLLTTRNFENRSLPEKSIDELIEYFITKGITPVIIGKTEKEIISSNKSYGKVYGDVPGVINLFDKTTLLEVARVMNDSICVIGPDQGLTHIAGMTDAKVICGFTTIRPELREPQRHGVQSWNWYSIFPEDGCRFCNTDWFVSTMKWDICEEKTLECLKALDSKHFIKVFEEKINI